MSTAKSSNGPTLRAEVRAGIVRALEGIAEAMRREARSRAPRKTGRLQGSIDAMAEVERGLVTLRAGAPHASFLHTGTGIHGPAHRPYTIRPRRKRALWWPGAPHPMGAVAHPGVRPRDYLLAASAPEFIIRAFHAAFDTPAPNNRKGAL
jgi:hypothetical protein